ncbi:hypothetical protein HDU85_004133 [Gaertneriomyces sp. JEL0708]|nr:hypothetical protein HDU85_004133 [Gaertneriomyces sp. JEL0708]
MADEGERLQITWFAPWIVSSYFVSTAGAWVALELFRLRSSNRGIFNWFLLLLASAAFGAIAVFTMHFIGMAAYELHSSVGVYSVRFVVRGGIISLVDAVLCVCVGGYIVGGVDHLRLRRLVAGGTCAAFGICLMHFTAMKAMEKAMQVRITWMPGMVFLSCLIALVATCTAFTVFFRLRALWQNSFWKQVGCAMLLAGAICSMHYTGMHAAIYTLDASVQPIPAFDVASILQIVVACCGVCGFLILVLLGMRIRNYYFSHSRKSGVVLAVLLLDSQGHVLVDSEGRLPSRQVLGHFDINPMRPMSHPALLWFLKASSAWDTMHSLAVAFKKNPLRIHKLLQDILSNDTPAPSPYLRLALISQVIALSTTLGIPFDAMGVVHDTLIEGRNGWVALVVDHVSDARASELAAKGFRWTNPQHVLRVVSSHLRVSTSVMRGVISGVSDVVSTRRRAMKGGLYVGVLVVQPTLHGFRIMTPTRDRTMVPCVETSPIAFTAMKEHWGRLEAFVKPVLVGAGMEMADFVAGSEIVSALTRCGVSVASGGGVLCVESLGMAKEVLVLHRERPLSMLAAASSPCNGSGGHPVDAQREGYPLASLVPFPTHVMKSPTSADMDVLMMTKFVKPDEKFQPPAGFTMVDLEVWEAVGYWRVFGEQVRAVVRGEMQSVGRCVSRQAVMGTGSLDDDDAVHGSGVRRDTERTVVVDVVGDEKTMAMQGAKKKRGRVASGCYETACDVGGESDGGGVETTMKKGEDEHVVLDVNEFLAMGPPPPGSQTVSGTTTGGVEGDTVSDMDGDSGTDTLPRKRRERYTSLLPRLFSVSRMGTGGSHGSGGGIRGLRSKSEGMVGVPLVSMAASSGFDKEIESESANGIGCGSGKEDVAEMWNGVRWIRLFVNRGLVNGVVGGVSGGSGGVSGSGVVSPM